MAVLTDLRPLAGEWVAEDPDGRMIAHAVTLKELERILIEEKHIPDDRLPAIRRVPEDGSTTFIL